MTTFITTTLAIALGVTLAAIPIIAAIFLFDHIDQWWYNRKHKRPEKSEMVKRFQTLAGIKTKQNRWLLHG